MSEITTIILSRKAKSGNTVFYVLIDGVEKLLDRFKEINEDDITKPATIHLDAQRRIVAVEVNGKISGQKPSKITVDSAEINPDKKTTKYQDEPMDDEILEYTAKEFRKSKNGNYQINGITVNLDYFPSLKEEDLTLVESIKYTTKIITTREGKEFEAIETLTFNNKKYTSQKPVQQNKAVRVGQNTPANTQDVTSPYNFVSLAEKIVPSEFILPSDDANEKDLPFFDRFNTNLNNGYIELEIETKTPIFVHNEDGKMLEKNDGTPVIPGSSIRGMLRNMVEIVSWSKFKLDENKKLFYRNVAVSKTTNNDSLENIYKNKVGIDNTSKNGRAGFLSFQNGKYYILPVENHYEKVSGTYAADYYYKSNEKSCEIFTNMYGKKNHYKIYYPEAATQNNKIELSEYSIKEYKNDIARKINIDLLASARKNKIILRKGTPIELGTNNKFGIPIFYIEDKILLEENENVKEINILLLGHTRNFRILHTYPIGQAIPGIHKEQTLDITSAIFGVLDKHKTRVDVGNAFTDNKNAIETEARLPKILASPKPTSYQLYLVQPNGEKTRKEDLNHWSNKQIEIRGDKLYWHRNTTQENEFKWWEDKDKKPSDSHFKFEIKPIKTGVKFISKIYYENLSKTELGALLFALQFPEETMCHKIGLGKPLGLGSIKININRLVKTDRTKRYSTLLNNGEWNTGEEDIKNEVNIFIAAFEKYILHQIGIPEEITSLWNTKRLQQLKEILDFKHTGDSVWNAKTNYMPMGDPRYRNKKPLPYILDIVKP